VNKRRRVLLLVGSAKRPRSTSESLGAYLLERLGEHGFETETVLLHRILRSNEGRAQLLAAVDRAELLVLAFPLYVDTLPYLVTRALELIAAHRRAVSSRFSQRFVALANCGFPEAPHNETALAICRLFARDTGLEWAGGLALGGGQAINGQRLSAQQGMARHVIAALDMVAEALASGCPVPPAAVGVMAESLIPAWAYMLLGGLGWRMQAWRNGALRRLAARPYVVETVGR
jgi:hypothetical protein